MPFTAEKVNAPPFSKTPYVKSELWAELYVSWTREKSVYEILQVSSLGPLEASKK